MDPTVETPGRVELHIGGGAKKEEEGQKKGEEEEMESLSVGENIYFAIVWIAVTAVMILYLTEISSQYFASKSNPNTIITFTQELSPPLPKVTICNWNQIIEPYVPCDFCDVELVLCQDIAHASDCAMTKMQIASVNASNGIFNCYQFNGDKNAVIKSNSIGYSGSYSALFLVNNPPLDDTLRIGLQVSLTTVEEDPDVFNEDKFAPPAFDTYFSIQTVHTIYQNTTDIPDNYRFDTTQSLTGLTRKNNDNSSYISVSWSFQTLNIQTITYAASYTLQNFFGDFAGMIGTLMGLDVVKVASGFIVAYTAIKSRSIFPLQDHFNG
eukprot:TRINITY_DN2696_c0_g1_i2.p1 TRINITY_DN2696_c0_g1~~TRINITY_DN2696_c0_g1_i2.p1  ORF type:complete len:324 (-),score=67.44 TRINITY_DN2696_c0_g1_i2:108-1079(-)